MKLGGAALLLPQQSQTLASPSAIILARLTYTFGVAGVRIYAFGSFYHDVPTSSRRWMAKMVRNRV